MPPSLLLTARLTFRFSLHRPASLPPRTSATPRLSRPKREYEKVCKEVVDTICDQPAVVPAAVGYHAIAKREADAEADPQFFAHPYAAHAVAAPLAAAPVAVAPV